MHLSAVEKQKYSETDQLDTIYLAPEESFIICVCKQARLRGMWCYEHFSLMHLMA